MLVYEDEVTNIVTTECNRYQRPQDSTLCNFYSHQSWEHKSVFPRLVYLTNMCTFVPPGNGARLHVFGHVSIFRGPSVTMTPRLRDEQRLLTYDVETCCCVPTTRSDLTKKWHVWTANIIQYVQWYVAKYTKQWKALAITTLNKT
jgi:hypothetical protein